MCTDANTAETADEEEKNGGNEDQMDVEDPVVEGKQEKERDQDKGNEEDEDEKDGEDEEQNEVSSDDDTPLGSSSNQL